MVAATIARRLLALEAAGAEELHVRTIAAALCFVAAALALLGHSHVTAALAPLAPRPSAMRAAPDVGAYVSAQMPGLYVLVVVVALLCGLALVAVEAIAAARQLRRPPLEVAPASAPARRA